MVAGTGGASSGPADPKLVALRQAMAAADGGKGVDVYVVPTEDPHMVWDGHSTYQAASCAAPMTAAMPRRCCGFMRVCLCLLDDARHHMILRRASPSSGQGRETPVQ